MRITEQYFWSIIFSIFFLALIVPAIIIIESEMAVRSFAEFTIIEYILLTLASWRLMRLVTTDSITKWFREQFWDAKTMKGGVMLLKPESGPRRILAELFSCHWCFGVWAAAITVFAYMICAWAVYPVTFLAIAGALSLLQILVDRKE